MAHLGWVARLAGRHDEALVHGRRAVALSERVAHPWYQPNAAALLATTLLELGRTAEATDLLIRACQHAQRDGAEAYLLRCLAPLAQANGSPADLAEADALLGRISAPAGCAWLVGTDVYLSVARAWLAHREPQRARAVLAPLLTAAERQPWAPAMAAGALVDGQAAAALDDPGARAMLATAADLAARYHMPAVEAAARRAERELPSGRKSDPRLPLLPADDPEVTKDLKKVSQGTPLSPVLLVRGELHTDRPLQIADGYHRVCASYHLDEDAEIPCRLVAPPAISA